VSDDYNSVIREQEQLAGKRYNWDNWWQDIAYRVMPSEAQFTTKSSEGERRTERQFSSDAPIANEKHAAVLNDLATPATQVWHMLGGKREELKENQSVKVYMERVNKTLFSQRYAPKANFTSQRHAGYLGMGAFGNSFMFIDEEISAQYRGPRYMQMHMASVWWGQNHRGMVDRFYRKFTWSAGEARKRFGDSLPDKVKQAEAHREFEFMHCVRPNDNMIRGRLDWAGMPYESWYLCCDVRAVIERGGYRCFPAAIGRYSMAPNEIYGRSPAMKAWASIMTINEQKKTVLRVGQKEADPPILLTEDGVLEAFNLQPGALNYGAISETGEQLVQPFKVGANLPAAIELMAMEKADIEESFLVQIFRVFAENPQMTATQVLELAQQRGVLLAPVMGRIQSEDLGPMVEREIDIASRQPGNEWMTEEMPDELVEDEGNYDIEYRSPLARAMRAQEGIAIVRTMEILPTAAAVDPNAAMVLDVPAAMREVAEIYGVPAKLIRDPKKIQAMIDAKEDAELQSSIAAAAPGISQAALNAAKAEQLRRSG
jgi:hypothetical protein